VLLDDALEDRRIAVRIPGAFRVDHRDRPGLTDAQAVRPRPQDAAFVRQPEFGEPLLEVIPRDDRSLAVAALGLGLIAAQQDVAPRHGNADALGIQPRRCQVVV
jgi:hypothetical protein